MEAARDAAFAETGTALIGPLRFSESRSSPRRRRQRYVPQVWSASELATASTFELLGKRGPVALHELQILFGPLSAMHGIRYPGEMLSHAVFKTDGAPLLTPGNEMAKQFFGPYVLEFDCVLADPTGRAFREGGFMTRAPLRSTGLIGGTCHRARPSTDLAQMAIAFVRLQLSAISLGADSARRTISVPCC